MTKKSSPGDGEPGKRRRSFDAIQSAMKDTHGWRPVEGVVAVHGPSNGPDLTSSLQDSKLANTVSPVARSLFAKAGWRFVNAEDNRAGSDAHEVLIDRDGQLKIVGSTIDVKFRPDVPSESIRAVLEDCGLAMVESYDFSKNLFSVKGDRILEKAIKLTSFEEVEFAEPSLIESISRR